MALMALNWTIFQLGQLVQSNVVWNSEPAHQARCHRTPGHLHTLTCYITEHVQAQVNPFTADPDKALHFAILV